MQVYSAHSVGSARPQCAKSPDRTAKISIASIRRDRDDTSSDRGGYGSDDMGTPRFSGLHDSKPWCDQAVVDVIQDVWRTDAPDTLPYSLAADTLPTAAVAVARACARRLTVAGTAPQDLWSLLMAFAVGTVS